MLMVTDDCMLLYMGKQCLQSLGCKFGGGGVTSLGVILLLYFVICAGFDYC